MRRFLILILINICFGIGVLRVEAQEQDSLYLQQLQKYDKLWDNYSHQQEAKKQLEYEITNHQHARYTLIKKIRELEGKRISFKNKEEVLQDEIADLQARLKEYELESVRLNQEYWQTQKNYGQYQEKLLALSQKQEQAIAHIKKREMTLKEMSGKLSLLQESTHKLKADADEIRNQIRLKEKKLQDLSTAKPRGR